MNCNCGRAITSTYRRPYQNPRVCEFCQRLKAAAASKRWRDRHPNQLAAIYLRRRIQRAIRRNAA